MLGSGLILFDRPEKGDRIAEDERIVAQCRGHLPIIPGGQVAALRRTTYGQAKRRDLHHAPGEGLRRRRRMYGDIEQSDRMAVTVLRSGRLMRG